MLRPVRVLFPACSVASFYCRQVGILSYPFFHEDRYLQRNRQIRLVGGLLPMATLTGNGLMSLEDKQRMFKSMPTSEGILIQIASVKRYTRFGAVIYNIPNNQVTQGIFLLKAGNGLTPTPTLIRLLGDNIAGSILYKMTDTTMDLFYKTPTNDIGPQDIFQTIIGTPTYTAYKGSIEDMTELSVS